jgi:hypothetical protein
VSALIDVGLEDTCDGLINFLTVAIAKPSGTIVEHLPCKNKLARLGFRWGLKSSATYSRKNIVYHDLSVLGAVLISPMTSDPVSLDVACGMRNMVARARAKCNDCGDSHDDERQPRSVREKVGENITDWRMLL